MVKKLNLAQLHFLEKSFEKHGSCQIARKGKQLIDNSQGFFDIFWRLSGCGEF
jgi:hypothetical protein